MLIDTHVHLDPYSQKEIEEILCRATNEDVRIVISAGTTLDSSKKNIEYSKINTELEIQINDEKFKCVVVEKPFFDPKKKITSSSL